MVVNDQEDCASTIGTGIGNEKNVTREFSWVLENRQRLIHSHPPTILYLSSSEPRPGGQDYPGSESELYRPAQGLKRGHQKSDGSSLPEKRRHRPGRDPMSNIGRQAAAW